MTFLQQTGKSTCCVATHALKFKNCFKFAKERRRWLGRCTALAGYVLNSWIMVLMRVCNATLACLAAFSRPTTSKLARRPAAFSWQHVLSCRRAYRCDKSKLARLTSHSAMCLLFKEEVSNLTCLFSFETLLQESTIMANGFHDSLYCSPWWVIKSFLMSSINLDAFCKYEYLTWTH